MLVHPETVNNDILVEAEIGIAVRGLKGLREGDLLGRRAEELEGWRKETDHEKDPKGRRR